MTAKFEFKRIDPKDSLGDHITVLGVRGALDYSNYMELINHTRWLYKNGVRRLLLDLNETDSVGLAGLFALFSTAVIFNGKEPADPVGGLRALHDMADEISASSSPNFKLFGPQPQVAEALGRTCLPVYEDLTTALESFYILAGWPLFEQVQAEACA